MSLAAKAAVGLAMVGGFTLAYGGLAPASAQAPGSGFAGSYSSNANKPVDISADVLEVDDRKKIAIFRGNVSATQGNVNLTSKEIHIAYTSAEKKVASAADASAPAPAPAPPASPGSPFGGGGSDITQIEAKGDVLVTMTPSKPGEKPQQSKSDWAIFDVKKQLITLGGNVVLSQGDNVMQGSTLVVDLSTGVTKFDNAASVSGSTRIRAKFEPPPKGKDKDDANR
jgi:lipopolysaccharide export system protein LptA